MSEQKGLHLIGDLRGCDLSTFVQAETELSQLKNDFSQVIGDHSLVELGHYYHFFGPRAVTATICLAESHINFHTWPEDNLVTLDLFICNYTQDNSRAAYAIFNYLTQDVFKAETVKMHEIIR